MRKAVKILLLGRLGYEQSLKLQKSISHQVKEKTLPDTLVIVEHNPVYTIGIREKSYTKEQENKLISLGAEFFRTNRGGLITFHGPGQLVVYPILDLRNYRLSIRPYVSRLEQTVIDLCESFGIKASTSVHTGADPPNSPLKSRNLQWFSSSRTTETGPKESVWVNDSKICALGIHVSHHVTTHGLALNCNTDLKWFSHIVPCGIEGKCVTSLSELLDRNVSTEDVLPNFKKSFSKMFKCAIDDFELGE